MNTAISSLINLEIDPKAIFSEIAQESIMIFMAQSNHQMLKIFQMIPLNVLCYFY